MKSTSLLPLFLSGALALLSAQTSLAQNQGNRPATGNFGGAFPGGGGAGGFQNFGGGASSAGSNGTRQYSNSTLVGDAMITSDIDTRRLIVVTDEETNESIKRVVAELDKPKPQVLINVVFVQVTHENDIDLGTEAKYTDNNIGHSTTQTAQTILGAPTTGGFYSLVNNNLDATIHALSTVGKTQILSRPSVLTRSSQQATILVGQQVPFITDSRITDTGQTINTVTYQDIGIILRVTPFITQQGMVEMIVSPEISSISSQTVQIAANVNTPVIDKRSADTVVVTPSDNTVVIGGLISNQINDTDSKVPILGDIPILGYAFKRKVRTHQKTELLVFMTPHVVQRPEDLVQITNAERANLELTTKAFDKTEINKYIHEDKTK